MTFLVVGIAILLGEGCTNKQQSFNEQSSNSEKAIFELKSRISKIESHLTKGSDPSLLFKAKIKSITFRIGTKDDRLRIYWSDGSRTDLPCTKEQSIWACG